MSASASDARRQGFSAIWPDGGALIGMVHLLPLPGAPLWAGSMDAVVERALRDAESIESAGFDAVLVENYGDVPFFADGLAPETIAGLTAAVAAVRRESALPVGVNALRNDARAALGIAATTGCRFMRVNVHTGSMWTDQGLIEGRAADTLRARRALGADVAILADVHVKHAVPPAGADLGLSAEDTWHRGLADGLIVSGTGTGAATPLDDIHRIREALPSAPIIVGSGATHDSVAGYLDVADGVIVGTSIMSAAKAGAGIDPARARAFVEAARRT